MTIQELAHKISIFRYISILLLLVVGLTSTRAASQTETAEWYYKRYANTPIEEVYQQGMTHLKKGETDKALACLTVVIGRYHNKMNDKERKTYEYALNNAGAIAMLRYDYSTAFSLFTKALDSADDSVAYRTHNNIAGIYIYYNDYPEFYEQFNMGSHPPRQLSSTCLIGIMNHLRIVGHWCIRMGYTTNRSCDAFAIPAAVHGSPYYLTLEERNKVFNADLSNKPELEVFRDLFMFQSLVGCRVGDMFSFTPENVTGDLLQYIPHKTMRKRTLTISVPLNTKALTILSRYKGKQAKLLPTKQIYQYNEGIRSVLKECGINRMVTILDTVTGNEVQKPICDVATSHMARRNFIGNLYKQVKDPDLISSMTGHVNGSRAFARYRDIDEETKVNLVNLIN